MGKSSKSEDGDKPNIDDNDLVDVVESVISNSTDNSSKSKEVDSKQSSEELLATSAKMVVETCMDIRRGENVLIVCDPTTGEIGQALHEAVTDRSERVLLIVMPKGRHHGEEPPSPVASLMRQQQVILAPTRYSLTHTRAVRQALKDGARVATMPGMTEEMFTHGGMAANFSEIKRKISNLGPYLRRRRIINVKSKQGTDITFEVNWRDWKLDDNGICNRPRMLTNLPAGKAFIMPREGSMNGKVIIDGSWDATLLDEDIELEIENGIVIDVKGGTTAANIRQEFGEVARTLRSKDRENVWTIAEFGFGVNSQARLGGNVLEDEKRLGTCYIAIGDNTALGGNSSVGIHIPGVLKSPSVWLDDTQILDNGKFILEL
ncbi:MAG: aminopeptidase [Candidatus Poseidoniaceae archaeon]|jgi:leucyl aminopeptidase (aminopeptidase T)|nr:aminopeptidase [Candidatus Poseidoniaceae archaeon]